MRTLGWVVAAVLRDAAEISSTGMATLVRESSAETAGQAMGGRPTWTVGLYGDADTGKDVCFPVSPATGLRAGFYDLRGPKIGQVLLRLELEDAGNLDEAQRSPGGNKSWGEAASTLLTDGFLMFYSEAKPDSFMHVMDWADNGSQRVLRTPKVLVAYTPAEAAGDPKDEDEAARSAQQSRQHRKAAERLGLPLVESSCHVVPFGPWKPDEAGAALLDALAKTLLEADAKQDADARAAGLDVDARAAARWHGNGNGLADARETLEFIAADMKLPFSGSATRKYRWRRQLDASDASERFMPNDF